MLTDTERDRLENRENEAASVRARNELVIRNKLGAWLSDLSDVLFIIDRLPEKQLKNVFSDDEIVLNIFALAKIAPVLRGFEPIYGPAKKPIVWSGEDKPPHSASYIEIDRIQFVLDLVDTLQERYDLDPRLIADIHHAWLDENRDIRQKHEIERLELRQKEEPPTD